jgi:hypothetical protein
MVAVAWDMFEQPTAIIVGAGSGVEYRMPLGAQLAADVAKAARFHFEHFNPTPTSGDQDLYRILHNRFLISASQRWIVSPLQVTHCHPPCRPLFRLTMRCINSVKIRKR